MYILGKAGSPAAPGTALVQRTSGLGCASCSSGAGCGCGLGIFDSTSIDVGSWGWMEWGAIVLGTYALFSMFSTTKRGVRSARKTVRSTAARRRRKKELQSELQGL